MHIFLLKTLAWHDFINRLYLTDSTQPFDTCSDSYSTNLPLNHPFPIWHIMDDLDIFFHESFIRYCLVFVFMLQMLLSINFTKIYQIIGLKLKKKNKRKSYEQFDLTHEFNLHGFTLLENWIEYCEGKQKTKSKFIPHSIRKPVWKST